MSAPLHGVWRAVSLVLSVDGELVHPLGPDPCGQLIYTADSRMSVQVMAARRSSFASGDMRVASPAEYQRAFETCISYFGAYDIDPDEQVVRHRIEASAFPNWTGKVETRAYRFVDGLLELRAPPERFEGREVVAIATWRPRT